MISLTAGIIDNDVVFISIKYLSTARINLFEAIIVNVLSIVATEIFA